MTEAGRPEVVDETRRPARARRAPAPPPPRPTARDRLRASLASPRAVRQAFLLREVLGPPVALRRTTNDDRGW